MLQRLVRAGLFALFTMAAPAALLAAEPSFPKGLGIGLAPPAGMSASTKFSGFEDEGSGASILMVEMPAEAYGQIEKNFTDEALKRQNIVVAKREAWPIEGGKGFLVSGTQAAGGSSVQKWVLIGGFPSATALVTVQVPPSASSSYSDEVVRSTLRTLAYRSPGSLDEQIAALPFTLGERAGFRPVRVLAGNSLMLTDGRKDVIKGVEQPILVVAAGDGVIPGTLEQDRLARAAFNGLAGVRAVQIKRAEGQERGGVAWHAIEGTAEHAETKEKVFVAQAIRFGPNSFVRMIGLARAKDRAAMLARFNKVRDGLSVK